MNAMDKSAKKQESALRAVETSEMQAITGGSATGGAGSGKAASTVSNLLQLLQLSAPPLHAPPHDI
jgi:hypothetical protein